MPYGELQRYLAKKALQKKQYDAATKIQRWVRRTLTLIEEDRIRKKLMRAAIFISVRFKIW